MTDNLNSYPFPSNVHVLSSVTLKLNDTNYPFWKTQIESLLSTQKLLGFVNGASIPLAATRTVTNGDVQTVEPNPPFESWFCSDQLVRSWIFGTLFEEVLGTVHTLATSREVWISLAESYNKSSLAREFSLRQNLQLLTKKDKSLAVYSREFKTICDSLSAIGKPIEESMKIFGFLNGLTREYDPIATVIQSSLTKFPTPTFNNVVYEVQGFDGRLQSYEDQTPVTPHLAFNTEQKQNAHEYKNTAPSYNPNYRGRGRSSFYKGMGGYSTRECGFTHHQTNTGGTGYRPTCQICGRIGHRALKCYNRFDNNYQGNAVFTSLRLTDESGREWFADSEATAHVTSNPAHLQEVHPYEGDDVFMVGDGVYLPITHTGSPTIT